MDMARARAMVHVHVPITIRVLVVRLLHVLQRKVVLSATTMVTVSMVYANVTPMHTAIIAIQRLDVLLRVHPTTTIQPVNVSANRDKCHRIVAITMDL